MKRKIKKRFQIKAVGFSSSRITFCSTPSLSFSRSRYDSEKTHNENQTKNVSFQLKHKQKLFFQMNKSHIIHKNPSSYFFACVIFFSPALPRRQKIIFFYIFNFAFYLLNIKKTHMNFLTNNLPGARSCICVTKKTFIFNLESNFWQNNMFCSKE